MRVFVSFNFEGTFKCYSEWTHEDEDEDGVKEEEEDKIQFQKLMKKFYALKTWRVRDEYKIDFLIFSFFFENSQKLI